MKNKPNLPASLALYALTAIFFTAAAGVIAGLIG